MATPRERLEELRSLDVANSRARLEQLRALDQEPRRLLGAAAARQQESIQPTEPTRAVQELPEIGFGGLMSGEDFATTSKVAAALAVTTDPQEMGQILTNLVPHIGITEDEQGNLIANNNKNGAQVIINKPGMSGLDFVQGVSIISAFTPASLVSSIPKNLAIKGGSGLATSGATQTAIEQGQELVGGEFDEDEIAIAAGLGGTAEIVLPVIQSLRKSRLQREAAQGGQNISDIKGLVDTAEEASEATKIPLFQAQKTAIPSQLQKQSFVQQLPAGTAKSSQELRKQNKAVSDAVDEFLEIIAPPESVVTGPRKIRTASQAAIDARILIRKEKASPLYKEAFAEGANVDLKPVFSEIKDILNKFPSNGQVFKSIAKVKKSIAGKNKKKPTLELLHNAKVEIDQMISKVGEGSLGNTTKAKLLGVQKTLLKQIDDSSDLYKQARELFAKESPAVDSLLTGRNAIIGNIAKVNDDQLKSIAGKIFDPKETNTQVMKRAKKIIEDIDPDAWKEIVRAEVENRLGAVRSTLEEGTLENIPDQMFRALFVPQKRRNILFQSLDREGVKNLRFLEVALGRARLGRVIGSPTAGREEIKKELRGGFWSAVREIIARPFSALGGAGVATLSGATADAAFDNNVRVLTNALFDPQWKLQMRDIRAATPNKAGKLMTELLNTVEASTRASVQLLDEAVATDVENIVSQ